MKTLPVVRATAEQLPLISQNRLGVEVICGAAGSGKTSTALLRLSSLSFMMEERFRRMGFQGPVRVLVLTFNKTLAGYITALAETQLAGRQGIEVEIDTFARWARTYLQAQNIAGEQATSGKLRQLARPLGSLSSEYIIQEVEYVLGRFAPNDLEQYMARPRSGRGTIPRVTQAARRTILDDVIYPYLAWLDEQHLIDWNGLAVRMAAANESLGYDIVIIDETQDFSANQLRAVRHHLADDHAITFVIDTVQRIYARGFTWTEGGFDVRPERIHVLRANHRNTVEIAAFAAGILQGIAVDSEGALPDLTSPTTHGPKPILLNGRYSRQLAWALNFIETSVDLAADSVAFLKPKGGAWFNDVKARLASSGINYAEITKNSEWPGGVENVALSTFHSAKGLEFDYVFILGINGENLPSSDEEADDVVFTQRKLLAVAVARARKMVVIGYKPGEESELMDFFEVGTFDEVRA